MDRRQLLKAGAAGALLPVADAMVAPPGKRRRPNLLYVFSDQHRSMSMPGEPFSPVIAPTLDAFRKQNVSMERCISNYPLCTPYRAMMMTGRWPYRNGATQNGAPLRPDVVSLGRVFRDAGYHTAYVGKWHLQGGGTGFVPPGPGRQGFEDWHVWEKTNDHFGSWTYDPVTGEKQLSTGWNCTRMTDQAIAILKQQKADVPWMMMVSWNPPHPPFEAPKEDGGRYDPATFLQRPNVLLTQEGSRQVHSDPNLREAMQGYYAAITGVDAEFARLLETLEETGQANDTIVVYTSDHGEMMGGHGRMAKMVPFEESCRVPFYVRYPGVTKSTAASTLFSAIDIYPTMCGLAGLPVPKTCDGRDLSRIIRGEPLADKPKAAFLMNQFNGGGEGEGEADGGGERHGGRRNKTPRPIAQRRSAAALATHGYNAPNYRGVRTDTHTYAVAENGRWCLFDNVADPYQRRNLIDDPKQAVLLKSLDVQIATWLEAAGDPFPFAQAITLRSPLPA